jgi:hypothetical protein
VVTGAPMFLHAQARELIILGMPLVVLGAIDQVNNIVGLRGIEWVFWGSEY